MGRREWTSGVDRSIIPLRSHCSNESLSAFAWLRNWPSIWSKDQRRANGQIFSKINPDFQGLNASKFQHAQKMVSADPLFFFLCFFDIFYFLCLPLARQAFSSFTKVQTLVFPMKGVVLSTALTVGWPLFICVFIGTKIYALSACWEWYKLYKISIIINYINFEKN